MLAITKSHKNKKKCATGGLHSREKYYIINILLTLKQNEYGLDAGAIPASSTISASVPCVDPLNQEARKSRDRPARLREWMCNCRCTYDGAE
jgi:hypothetical protein